MAAALYKGGISFGGTVAFIFADLISLPLVLIYGKFYGRHLAVRLFLSFWAVMSTAGLITDLLFRAVGIGFPRRRSQISPTHFGWNITSLLNLLFLVLAAFVYWAYRNRASWGAGALGRWGAGDAYAKDVVCGMQVERAMAPASAQYDGRTFSFCSDHCEHRFLADPGRFHRASGTQTSR